MYNSKVIDTDHKDVIHDIAFDFYGRRMATCSSDQLVKIWNLDDDGNWVLDSTLKSPSGAVWKVTWAHPEFGQIIATCSFDRSATIYEDSISDKGHGMKRSWIKRCPLVDARSSVTDVKFAPKSMGLVLAVCCADGLVRLYEAYDIMNLSQWATVHDINTRLPCCSCISWNPSPSRFSAPLLAVGSDDGCLANSSNNSSGGTMSITNTNTPNNASNNTARVAIFAYCDNGRRWEQVETLLSITDRVHDIAFAPNPGRSFHILAVASKDLKIIVLKPKPANSDGSCGGFDLAVAGQFADHGSNVWRVSWNVTGTVVSASGDNGLVKIYKANYLDVWKCVGTLSSFGAVPHSISDRPDEEEQPVQPQQTFGNSAQSLATNKSSAVGAVAAAAASGARYLKMASTNNPGTVVWH
ncbi:nucleoporin SEH1 [Hyalella azteca]|uniref:Nucleoporin SEH1 n=1 Tax=Hyalella azteca TaxID=294128 RepID=A0A8B7P4Z1_HYAAZ|nr:nucleoporin SEH1 [Hyalella azteca]